LAKPLREGSEVACAGATRAGLVVARLDVLEPPGDLRESTVKQELAGRAESAIGASGQFRQVRKQSRRVGVIR
jgi:hypothetical protein